MASNRTSGFDLLIQISEAELNNQVVLAFAKGLPLDKTMSDTSELLLPPSLQVPIDVLGITGNLDLNFQTPIVALDEPSPQVRFTIPFTESSLEILTAPPFSNLKGVIAHLAGTIVVMDAVRMRTVGGTQQAVMDFTAGAPAVLLSFDAKTAKLLEPALQRLKTTLPTAQSQMAAAVRQRLVTGVGRIPLSLRIPVADDSDPLTPFSLEVTTVNDATAADRDALTFGVRTSATSQGDIQSVTQSFIPAGSPALLMMSNSFLLSSVVRPRLAARLGLQVTDFDAPLRLNHAVPAPGGQGTLTDLEARVEDNHIRIDGRSTKSGTGWSAVATFTFFLELSLSGGVIQITASTPSVEVDVSFEWWVWLTAIALGALFGGIVGAVIGAIIPVIGSAIAEGIAEKKASKALSGTISSIPPVPLGPIGSALTVASLVLDDLEISGPILYASLPAAPVPRLDLAAAWEVLEKGQAQPILGPDLASCLEFAVSRRCTIEASPHLAAFPVVYQWTLAGTALQEGDGTLQLAGGALSYHLSGSQLVLETKMGKAITCELCVSAIDAKNRQLSTCITLEKDATEITCGPGKKLFPLPSLKIIPCDPSIAIATPELVLSSIVQEHLVHAFEAAF
jgi:hypothetical protein